MDISNEIIFLGEPGCSAGVRLHYSYSVKETCTLDVLYKKTSAPMVIFVDYFYFCNHPEKLQFVSIKERLLIVYNVPVHSTISSSIALQKIKGIIYKGANNQHFEDCLKEVSRGGFWLPRKMMYEMLNYYRT
ncbi:hypothetical protein [Vibrio owensii]|uniref:hypothetical protein n=1 Tax=Vibrio owensii TaxID=696485 RepID=UPI000597AE16|nr:hypothetical protein [Vibrio owensii]